MPDLADRYREIARRAEDPRPVAERAREVLAAGKREQLLAGEDAQGRPFAPLAPSTLRRPRRSPTPLVPDGPDSGLIAGYVVVVAARGHRLEFEAGWPGRRSVPYLRSGTRRMPARDPGGFRDADRAALLSLLSEHVRGSNR